MDREKINKLISTILDRLQMGAESGQPVERELVSLLALLASFK